MSSERTDDGRDGLPDGLRSKLDEIVPKMSAVFGSHHKRPPDRLETGIRVALSGMRADYRADVGS